MIENQPTTTVLCNVSEAGQILGVSESTVWRMIQRGTLRSIRQRGRRLIPREALEQQAASRQTDKVPSLSIENPIFRLVGAGRSGGQLPGARDKHAILDK